MIEDKFQKLDWRIQEFFSIRGKNYLVRKSKLYRTLLFLTIQMTTSFLKITKFQNWVQTQDWIKNQTTYHFHFGRMIKADNHQESLAVWRHKEKMLLDSLNKESSKWNSMKESKWQDYKIRDARFRTLISI